MFCHGARVGFYQGDISLLMDDIKTLKPTFFPVVPRLLNRIYDKVCSAQQCWVLRHKWRIITHFKVMNVICVCRFWALLRLRWEESFFITPWGGNRQNWAVESWGTTACGIDWSSIRYRYISVTITKRSCYWTIWWKDIGAPLCRYIYNIICYMFVTWAERNNVYSFVSLSLSSCRPVWVETCDSSSLHLHQSLQLSFPSSGPPSAVWWESSLKCTI